MLKLFKTKVLKAELLKGFQNFQHQYVFSLIILKRKEFQVLISSILTNVDSSSIIFIVFCRILGRFCYLDYGKRKEHIFMENVLEVRGLSKQYKKGVYASQNVTFDVKKGEIFALIGPNGAGKTTTIRMISTLLKATEGDAVVMGHSILTEPEKVRENITYLPDEAGAYKTMTGKKYLQFMASIYANDSASAAEYVKTASEICGLGDRLDDKIGSYSRGMTRKLLLARAIMSKPALAILDEPTSGLDIINALEIRRMIKELASQGMSFLLSSHNMLEIEYVSDRVGIIAKGHLLETGTPAELLEKHGAANLEEVFERAVKSSEIL